MVIGDSRPRTRGVLAFDELCFLRFTDELLPAQAQVPDAPARAQVPDALTQETQRIREYLIKKQRSEKDVKRTTACKQTDSARDEPVHTEGHRDKTSNKHDTCRVCGLRVKDGAKRTFGRSKACNRRARWCDGECAKRLAERNGCGAAETDAAPHEPEKCELCGKVIKEGSGWRKVCNGKCHTKHHKRRPK